MVLLIASVPFLAEDDVDDIHWSDTVSGRVVEMVVDRLLKEMTQAASEYDSYEARYSYGGTGSKPGRSTPGAYYYDSDDSESSGMIIFESGRTSLTWRIHRSVILHESDLFTQVHDFGRTEGLVRVGPNRYRCTKARDMALDWFFRCLQPKLGQEFPLYQLCRALSIATDWGFIDPRTRIIYAITKHDSDPKVPLSEKMTIIVKIRLARHAKVPDWLRDTYLVLATRTGSVGAEEADAIGGEAFTAITQAREKISRRRSGLIVGDRPAAWMGHWFWHSKCWRALSEAWKGALGNTKALNPDEALFLELGAMRRALDPKKLCGSCYDRAKIIEWLDLGQDRIIAEKVLTGALGPNHKTWIFPQ